MKRPRRSIRSRLIALSILPLASMTVLWLFAASLTLADALTLMDVRTQAKGIAAPTSLMMNELRLERRLSMVKLSVGATAGTAAALDAQRVRTDQAIDRMRDIVTSDKVRDTFSNLQRQRIRDQLIRLRTLPTERGLVDHGTTDRAQTFQYFNQLLDDAFSIYGSIVTIDDSEARKDGDALIALAHAREMLTREDALVSGIGATGVITQAERDQIVEHVGIARHLYQVAAPKLRTSERQIFDAVTARSEFARLRTLEDTLVGQSVAGRRLPIDLGLWRSTLDTVYNGLREYASGGSARLVERIMPVVIGVMVRLLCTLVIGLLTVIGSIWISLRIGRTLARRMLSLRDTARELAGTRLPAVVSRLRRGEEVDVAAESPPLARTDDELGEVAEAINDVQRTAIASAVDEAALRRGINQIFLNIARRYQTLLHRQLSLLDVMERRADAAELEDLFKVDHLATRMRRHAEDLAILAGAAPKRVWRSPVPLINVLRGAISEVEGYQRIDLRHVPEGQLDGKAVADVMHLLAELMENATLFSPPHTEVRVTGSWAANGFVIEIEDQGLGLRPESLDALNERLGKVPEFDPMNSSQLGLFVVARLSARCGSKVHLRESSFGGVTAIVLLPKELIIPEEPQPAVTSAAAPAAD